MLNIDDIKEIKRQLSAELLPIGTILIFPYEKCPDGFIPCEGQRLSKLDYRALYELIGGTFGSDDKTFLIPDLRGKFVRGYDCTGTYDCNHKFGEYQADALQGHSHRINWSCDETKPSGAHSHLYYAECWNRVKGFDGNGDYVHENKDYDGRTSYSKKTSSAECHTHTLPDISINEVTSSNKGLVRSATETRPKNIALNFCIKVK